jgi:hypothetical protein
MVAFGFDIGGAVRQWSGNLKWIRISMNAKDRIAAHASCPLCATCYSTGVVNRSAAVRIDTVYCCSTIIVLILAFSLTDAFLTLWLVDSGATEINPIMAYFLTHGPGVFIGMKYLFTCCSVVILVVCSNIFLRRVGIYIRTIITSILMLFSSVIAWEIYLLVRYVY